MLDPKGSHSEIAALVMIAVVVVVASNLSGKWRIHIFHGVVMELFELMCRDSKIAVVVVVAVCTDETPVVVAVARMHLVLNGTLESKMLMTVVGSMLLLLNRRW